MHRRADCQGARGERLVDISKDVLDGFDTNAETLPGGSFRADLYVLRALYSVNPRLFVDGLVQYNTETERVFTTARLNFTYRPLSDNSLVLNENRLTASGRVPEPARALMFKFTRLLQF